ncbi:MAG: hypothetical protein KF752_15320 [Pirellulaceae bacterium]|nr:hypothetical protein [Pirellulaceae bacterium]
MARAYSGVLSAVALSLAITRGLVLGMPPNEILTQSLLFFFVFAGIGLVIGYTADRVVAESVETRFRQEIASLETRAASRPDSVGSSEKLA